MELKSQKDILIENGWKEIGTDNGLFTTMYLKHDSNNITLSQYFNSKDGEITTISSTIYLTPDMLKEIEK